MKKILLIIAVSIIIACALGCKNSSQSPTAKIAGVPNNGVATVNGLIISTKDYQTYLNENFGDKALTTLIQQKITESWAKDEGVSPTKEQIEKEIEKLKYEGQYEDYLDQVGEWGLNQLIFDQLVRTNLSKKLYPPTEQEIKEGFNNLKQEYIHGPRKQIFLMISPEKSSLEAVLKETNSIKDADAFAKKIRELSKNYTEDKSIKTGTIWIGEDSNGMPEELLKAIKSMDVNETSKVQELKIDGQPSTFYAFKVIKAEEKTEKKLEDVKDEVIDKVALFNTMMKPEFRDALQKKTEEAKINIKIDKFKNLAETITKPAPIMPQQPAQAPAQTKK